MGLLNLFFGRKEKKLSSNEAKEWMGLGLEKEKRRSSNTFFDEMRKFNELKKEMAEEEENKVESILDKYGGSLKDNDDDEGSGFEDQMMSKIFENVMQPKQAHSAPATPSPVVEADFSDVAATSDVYKTNEEVVSAASKLKALIPKKFRSLALNEISKLSDKDIVRLKKELAKGV